jgi:hypothetical protein
MKKFLAFIASLLVVGVLTFIVMAFTDNDPKKQKSETTASACDTTKACCHQQDATADGTEKHCCKDDNKTASGDCAKSKACAHHAEKTADATTEKK